MAINLNIPQQKKIVNVEWSNLDQVGFGWDGQFTRERWREVCLEYLQKGKDEFLAWQDSWEQKVDSTLPDVSFECKLIYGDGSHEIVLQYANEPCSLDFSGHIFKSWLHCREFKFKKSALFAGVSFNGAVIFDASYFGSKADFEKATFNSGAYFNDSIFVSDTFFEGVTFRRYAYFNRIVFNSDLYFKNAIFEDILLFENTSISGETYFENTFHNGFAVFENSIFNGYTDFESNIFCQSALFNRATFKEDVNYRGTTFGGNANFFKTKFLNQCRFDNELDEETKEWPNETRFFGAVNFENAEIQNVGHFERVKFNGEIPNFLGVDNAKTLLIFSGDEYFNKDDTTEDAVKRIGQLKRLADEQGQTDQALMFNAFELNAKAKQPNAGIGLIVVTTLYDYVSDFGRSFVRPLGVYVCLLFLTFLITLEHSAYNAPRNYTQSGCEKYVWWVERVTWVGDKNCLGGEKVHKLTGIRAAGEYTLYRAVGVLDFADSDKQTIEVANRVFGQDYEPWWMRIWGVFKAITSTALLFLAALGLRNKYRIK